MIQRRVKSFEQCIKESLIDRRLTRVPLQKTNEHITAKEGAMHIDLVPQLPLSGHSDMIVKAMDVFSRYSFAYPTSN